MLTFATVGVAASAQSIVENQSASTAVIVRDPARQSSTEVDAAIYNPAGTAFLKEGLSLSASGIANIGSTKANDGTKDYKISENYVMPSVQAAFKTGKWSFSGSFASEGGYRRNYKDGSPVTEGYVGLINESITKYSKKLQLTGLLFDLLDKYSDIHNIGMHSDDKMQVSQYPSKSHLYNWTIRLGAAYEISEHLSAYAGLKLNRVSWKSKPKFGMEVHNLSSGTTTPFSEYSKNVSEQLENVNDESFQEAKEGVLSQLQACDVINNVLTNSFSSSFSHTENGWGITPVIGLDYKSQAFNVGMKYEFGSHINVCDGEDFTLPATLSLGGNWQSTQWLNVAVGGDFYFKSAGNPFCAFDDNVYWDVSVSATFTCNKHLKASVGWQIGKQSAWEEDFAYKDNLSGDMYIYPGKVSAGIRYAFTDKISVDFGIAIMSEQSVCTNNNHNYNFHFEGDFDVFPDYSGNTSNVVTYKKKTPVQISLGINYNL